MREALGPPAGHASHLRQEGHISNTSTILKHERFKMYKQKDCSDSQNHYIYKNISLKNLGLSKTLTQKYKSMMEGPKAHVHMYVC